MGKRFTGVREAGSWLKRSVYAFPLVLVILLALLASLKVNGSSTGIYNSLLNGSQAHNPGLIYGHPRSIRSDEFLTSTPLVALQSQSDYPQFNNKLGSGRDITINSDAPTKNWLTLFRPHNWAFFVMPFENAFAFRWWLGLILLIISAYFFLLRVLDGNKKVSILLSLAFGISPFFLWWYQNDLFMAVAYGFMMMILGMRIINQERIPKLKSMRTTNLAYLLALTYIGACFVLLIYAPFLISVFLAAMAFIIGYGLNERFTNKTLATRQLLKRWGLMLTPLVAIAPIALLYVTEHKTAIRALAHSVYPGQRVTTSGQLPFSHVYRFFDGFLQPLLQHPPVGHFYTNQSEASNFILLLPFLLVPGVILQVYDYVKNRRVNWTFLSVQLVSLLLILRITVPVGNSFYKLLLLNRVPNNRLLAGIGLLGFLQLILLIKYLPAVKIPKKIWGIVASAISLLTLVWLLVLTEFSFRTYLTHKYVFMAAGLALLFSAIIAAFLFNKKLLGAILFLIFTLGSSFSIIPLQRGLPFADNSRIVNDIKRVSSPSDSWAVVDDFTFETVPWMAGRKMVSGPQIYPDLSFWRQLDPTGQLERIYNREAHALFISDSAEAGPFLSADFAKKMTQNLELVKGNVFKVRFTCSSFVYKNVNFVLTTHQLNMSCLVPVNNVVYPRATFFIYKVHPPTEATRR